MDETLMRTLIIATLLLLQQGMIPVVDTKGIPAVPLNPCLVSAWPMNDGSGTTFASTGGTNTATVISGSITWQSNAGLPGTTPAWGATGIGRATSTTLTNFTGTTAFSVSVWAYQSAGGSAMMSTLDTSSGFKGWELASKSAGSNTLNFFLVNSYPGNAIDVQAGTGVTAGALGYFVATYDGSQTAAGVKLYANGTLLTNTVNVNTLSASTANSLPVNFAARRDGTQKFGGAMAFDEVYNCVLTPTQISTYNAAGPGIY